MNSFNLKTGRQVLDIIFIRYKYGYLPLSNTVFSLPFRFVFYNSVAFSITEIISGFFSVAFSIMEIISGFFLVFFFITEIIARLCRSF